MSSVDSRVVELKFNQGAFAKGIADTLAALTRLQDGLKLDGASRGAEQAQTGLDQLGQKTGFLGGQFTALQAVAFGALASIGSKALQVGEQVASALTIDPLSSGLQEYETNLNSIQTILANTQVSGAGLPEVNAALDELNHYSDQTIYNFSEMARNIGTFTAAGVDLNTATDSIKGIANLAALSGSNSQQASGAMYQLSQAISAGRVSLMDWNSVVNAGMGGTVFQRALAQNAVAMGTLSDSAVTLEGDMQNVSISGKSFRDSIDATNGPSWLTSDVLTSTLQQFTGDLTDAELAAQGFTAEQIASIQATAQTAQHAATEVKTLRQVFDVAKETAGSGWAQTWRTVFGDFEEAKTTFTQLSGWVNGFINRSADARNNLLQGWKDLGGRDVMLEGFVNAGRALMGVLKPIGDAFRSIFPRQTAEGLFSLTTGFRDLMAALIPSEQTTENIRRTFAGLFAVLGIGWEIIKAGVGFITDLIGAFGGGAGGGILSFTANIGDFLVALHEAIKSGDVFGKFFDGLAAVIRVPIAAIQALIGWIKGLFSDTNVDAGAEGLSDAMDSVSTAGDRMKAIFSNIADALSTAGEKIGNFVGGIIDWFKNLGNVMSENNWDFNADTIMKALGIGAGVGLGALLIKALNGIKSAIGNFDLFGGSGSGMLDSVKDALDGLSGTLQGMQQNLKANALLKIAGAIGIMALAVLVLAGIPADGLVRASIAMAVMFGQLVIAMKLLDQIGGVASAIKLTILSGGLILLATAVLILASAAKVLASMSWGELTKGLVGLIVILGALAAAVKLMSGKDQVMIKTGAAILLLAIGVRILVEAVQALSEMSWGEMIKGLVGVGILLGALALFTKFAEADSGGLSQGLGLVLLAVALKLLAEAVGEFAQYNWEELAQGMVGIGVGLAIIAGALQIMPEGSLLKAAGVLVIAFALGIIADAVGKFAAYNWEETAQGLVTMAVALGVISMAIDSLPKGAIFSAAAILVVAVALGFVADALEQIGNMSWGSIAKGLIALSAALLVMVIAVNAMEGALPGAAAMLIVAAALLILVPAIEALGAMSWGDLIKGLVGLALAFTILAVGGLVLGVLSPLLLAAGLGLLVLGAGLVVVAAAAVLFSVAMTAIAASGAAAGLALVGIITAFLGLLPLAAQMLADAIVAFVVTIAQGTPQLIEAFGAIFVGLLQVVIDTVPKIQETVLTLLFAMLSTITQAIPAIVEAGWQVLLAFLTGMANHIPDLVNTVSDIIVNFLNSMANNMGRIVTAGANLVISFINGIANNIGGVIDAGFNLIVSTLEGIADGIDNHLGEIGDAALDIVQALIDGIVDGVADLAGEALDAVTDLAGDLWDGAMDFLGIGGPSKLFRDSVGVGIPIGIADGIDKGSADAVGATVALGENMLSTMGKTIAGLNDMISGMDDLNPVITPVLDLSAVQKGSGAIGDILSDAPIDLSDAMANASDASAGYSANLDALSELVGTRSGTTNNFTQNNYSPKALSQAEIYRQSNNLLSQKKGALTNVN